jgi:UDP-N-acetylmuramoylalanine--D-glutamate ligase
VKFSQSDNKHRLNIAVLGLGKTGYSCVEYLIQQGHHVCVFDQQPPLLRTQLQQHHPTVEVCVGDFSFECLSQMDEIVVSPGVSLQQPVLQQLVKQGASITGDVELFLRQTNVPIIAITGSNGKTTVATWVGEMLQHAGFSAVVCGNIGVPVLEQLHQPTPDYYVLELSSFQLETIYSLRAKVALLLNICEDHMDRYESFEDYLQAKQAVYANCEIAILNQDQSQCWQALALPQCSLTFSSDNSVGDSFCLEREQDHVYLTFQAKRLLDTASMKVYGQHQWLNALAVLAVGYALDVPMPLMLEALTRFQGLPHRCQVVSDYQEVCWINDSKATNVGAAIAAIQSVSAASQGRIFLIAGGDAKQADLSPLKGVVKHCISHVFLLGQDADQLQRILMGAASLSCVQNLSEAVSQIARLTAPGDTVLLSPACASWDMFDNYQQRGEMFIAAIKELHGE